MRYKNTIVRGNKDKILRYECRIVRRFNLKLWAVSVKLWGKNDRNLRYKFRTVKKINWLWDVSVKLWGKKDRIDINLEM